MTIYIYLLAKIGVDTAENEPLAELLQRAFLRPAFGRREGGSDAFGNDAAFGGGSLQRGGNGENYPDYIEEAAFLGTFATHK